MKVKVTLDGITAIEVELTPELEAQFKKTLFGSYSIAATSDDKEVNGL